MEYFKILVLNISIFCINYYAVLYIIQLAQIVISFFNIKISNTRYRNLDYKRYINSENLMPVSVIVPVYNDVDCVVSGIERFMDLEYPQMEIIIINDGSGDGTHHQILKRFEFEKIDTAARISLKTEGVRNVYYSSKYPSVLYIDKKHGGRADAINCGINFSQCPLYICLDVNAYIEKDSVLRLAVEFLKNSATVISSGVFRISDKAKTSVLVKNSYFSPASALEYFQALDCIKLSLLDKINKYVNDYMFTPLGTFGIFNKQIVIDCGGYRTNIIGEHYDLVLRIQKHLRDSKRVCTFKAHNDIICWLGRNHPLADLQEQRKVWQFALLDNLLFRHFNLFFNRTYRRLGFVIVPYSWFIESFYAVIEFAGYIFIPLSLFFGMISFKTFVFYVAVKWFLNIAISLSAIIIEQYTNAISVKQCMNFVLHAIVENFGYRQAMVFSRVAGIFGYRKYRYNLSKEQ